jgi:hypothetical protein
MSRNIKVIDCDVIYLSYDEPNAEENYSNLLTKVPWAKRVHGVDGSDAAHKACAKLSTTNHVVIVDGDNIIKENFIEQQVFFKDDNVDLGRSVISWGAKNAINGLIYGNGGIKCWPKQLILDMKTHENADPTNVKTQVDFCWDINYIQMDECMSDVHNNASPQQAWRAGFREGVKMSLIEGSKLADPGQIAKLVHWKNFHRLMIWMHIGADVKNGLWALYGARQGCYMTNCTDWDYLNVRDFKWLNDFWKSDVNHNSDNLTEEIEKLGDKLRSNIGLDMADIFSASQSRMFKTMYTNPPRMKNNSVVSA